MAEAILDRRRHIELRGPSYRTRHLTRKEKNSAKASTAPGARISGTPVPDFPEPTLVRFAGTALQVLIARRYVELVVRRLPKLEAEARELIMGNLREAGLEDDEVERSIAWQEIGFLQEDFPRLEAYGAVLVLYTVFETTVRRLEAFLRGVGGIRNGIDKAGGANFVQKAGRSFRDEARIALARTPSEYEQ